MMDLLKREWGFFLEGVKKVKLKNFTKEDIFREIISNGVASLVAACVYWFLSSLFIVRGGFEHGLKKTFSPGKMSAMEISKKEFSSIMDWIGLPIIFILSLVVFSIVEQIMEHYLSARKNTENRSDSDVY